MIPSNDRRGEFRRWSLPPLILHPFDDRSGVDAIGDALGCPSAARSYLEGRYAELRMLCFIGKDLDRWLQQCVEFAATDSTLCSAGLGEASFANLLLFEAPAGIARKLHEWEVANHQLIFSRGIGLNAVFPHPPEPAQVSESLLCHFHRYADALFDLRLAQGSGAELDGASFHFELYASAEYSRLLEDAWSEPLR